MPTHLYGILLDRNAHRVPGIPVGLAESEVRLLRSGPLAALASTVAGAAPDSMDAFKEHERVLTAVVSGGGSVTSVRYGQKFADDDEARDYLARNAHGLVELLERQDGCVEMHLLLRIASTEEWDVLTPPGEKREVPLPVPPGRGRAYLEQLKAEAAAFHPPSRHSAMHLLGDVVRAERFDSGGGGRHNSFSHLVRHGDVPAYRDAVQRLEVLKRSIVVGPLPFYSFSQLDDE